MEWSNQFMIYRFGNCELDTTRYELHRGGVPVPVEPQVFDVLRLLTENAGSLVTKDQLIDDVWDGRIVSEATVSSRINAARVAVGDNGKDQNVIRTISRRGFQMVEEVTVSEEAGFAGASPLQQTIRFTSSPDGKSIAWSSVGDGSPVVYCWHHLSHLEMDWNCRLLERGLRAFSERHKLIRYDIRGSGLSDPIDDSDTIDQHVQDLIAVADAASLDRFPVVAVLQSAAVAVRAAARNPDRISRLVLHNGYARGRSLRENAPDQPEHDPFIALLNSGNWGNPEDAFMRAWATMVLPSATPDETTELIELISNSGTTRDALLQRNLIDRLDVTKDLAEVHCPTRVIHSRLCAIHPVVEGRRLAAGIPNAEFLEVDSANTFMISSDPALEKQLDATLSFLDQE